MPKIGAEYDPLGKVQVDSLFSAGPLPEDNTRFRIVWCNVD